MRKGIVIMIENQAHRVLEVFELNRLDLFDLLIGDLPLSDKAVKLLSCYVLDPQTQSFSYRKLSVTVNM